MSATAKEENMSDKSSTKKGKRAFLYTRVSTAHQVEGFSLEAQTESLMDYIKFKKMEVVDTFSDEGKSGKTIEGRPDFSRMISLIEENANKDNSNNIVDYVVVFKLSRFGRNAADTLSTLRRMQNCGVELISVEDNIDSSDKMGTLLISILASLAEMERENISLQTFAGKAYKVSNLGAWAGGFAPYGYKLVDKKLEIAEDECEVIKLIYDKYVNSSMGIAGIVSYLHDHGYKKKIRQNGKLDYFTTGFVKAVLDNPVYAGKIAFGRRKTEKISPGSEKTHMVKQKEFPIYDGIHEALVSEELWGLAHAKRVAHGIKQQKKHSIDHAYLLSGLLRCPVCGGPMYGNVSHKKNKNKGGYYKDYHYYYCKHRLKINGASCDYKVNWLETKVNDAVLEMFFQLIDNEKISIALRDKLNVEVDITSLQNEKEKLKKSLSQYVTARSHLEKEIDNLAFDTPHYAKIRQDLSVRLYSLYDDEARVENEIENVQARIDAIIKDNASIDNAYEILKSFKSIWEKCVDLEKKELIRFLVEKVEIYENELENGRFLKSVKLRFPLIYKGLECDTFGLDKDGHVETVALLTQMKPDDYVTIELNEEDLRKGKILW